jgi:tRNA threonylcarbamoyladenosine biosynthesis protein TsaB
VLAIESASRDLGVALVGEEGTISSYVVSGSRRHVEVLLPAIEAVLDAGGVSPKELDGIAVDIGPGLFTGLRAGVAAAKGLGLGAGLPIVGVRSTAVLRAALADVAVSVAAALDVRRGEVAIEFPGDDDASLSSFSVALDRLDALESAESTVLIGNGWTHDQAGIASRFGKRVRFAGPDFENPAAGVLGRIGCTMFLAGAGVAPALLGVEYLRDADVAITWTTRAQEGV